MKPKNSESAPKDEPGKAILFLLFGVAAGLGLDITAKWLLQDYALTQFVFLRSIFGVMFLGLMASRFGGFQALKTQRWGWHILRTILASGAMFGFFYGLSQMPLVNALTIGFLSPLIVTALSVPFLGERVGWRRWSAVMVGFLGVLIVLRPESGTINTASLAVLAAAFSYACLAITARKLAPTESSYALSVYVIVGPMLISGFLLERNWSPPDVTAWFLFALAGACSALAWVGIVGGYRRATPSILAPFEYTALVGGALAGYWLWGEVPDIWVVAGGVVIIGSGLYIVHREVGQSLGTRYLRGFTAGAAAAIARRLRKKNRND